MGNYAAVEDLEQRTGSERFHAFCGNDAEIADVLISRAEGIIHGFASVLYETPMEPAPLLQEWTLALAEHELWKRGAGSEIPEKIRGSFRDTLEQLSLLSLGKIETGGVVKPKVKQAAPIQTAHGSFSRFL